MLTLAQVDKRFGVFDPVEEAPPRLHLSHAMFYYQLQILNTLMDESKTEPFIGTLYGLAWVQRQEPVEMLQTFLEWRLR